MTLSALAGNPIGGVVLGLAYVFGMVFPLFAMALIWDVTGLRDKPLVARPVRLQIGTWTLRTNVVNLGVALGFAVMGVFIIYLANAGQMTSGPEIQVATGRALAGWLASLEAWLSPVPEPVLGLGLLALAGIFIWGTLIGRHSRASETAAATQEGESGHSTSEPSSHCH
jgi:hypothetical protein